MSQTAGTGTLSQFAQQKLKVMSDEIADAGIADDPFVLDNLEDDVRATIIALMKTSAVRQVDAIPTDQGRGPTGVYRLHEDAVTLVERTNATQYAPCPCGHGGLRTLAEGYTCTYDRCDAVYERAALEVDG